MNGRSRSGCAPIVARRTLWAEQWLLIAIAASALLGITTHVHAESRLTDCGTSSAYAPSEWPGFKGCPTGLGLSDLQGATTNTPQWSTTLSLVPLFPGQVSASIVYGVDGTAYVGTSEGIFYALRPTGTMIWWANIGARIRAAAAVGADGTIYVTSDAGTLTALNPSNGAIKWTFTGVPWNPVYTAPAIGPDGTLFYGDSTGFLYAVNPNGTLKWTFNTLGPVWATPVLSRDGRTLYVGNEFLTFRALNAQTGAQLWIRPDWTGNTATAAVGDDGTIYSVSDRGFVHALNPSTGAALWTYPTLSVIHASPSILPNGDIAVVDVWGTMTVLSPAGGLRWSRNLGGRVSSTPTVDKNGVIYVGTGGGFHTTLGIVSAILPGNKGLLALNGATGATIWSAPTLTGIPTSPAISRRGTILVGSDDGFVHAIGSPLPGSAVRPTWPEDDVLVNILRSPIPGVDCNVPPGGTRPSSCTFAPPRVNVMPGTCTDPTAPRFTKTTSSVAGPSGLVDVIGSVRLISPVNCGGRLCGINADDPSLFTETPLAVATETPLLSAPSDAAPGTNRNLPSGAVASCGATSAPPTCPINPATVITSAACTFDGDCAAGYRCASVCLNAAGTAVLVNPDPICATPVMRCGRPSETTSMSCSAGAMPAVTTTTLPAALPPRTADFQNYPCHEVRECGEEGAVISNAAPTCRDAAGAVIACNANQNPPATPNPPAPAPTFSVADFYSLSDLPNTKCNYGQIGAAGATKDVASNGAKDSASGSSKPNNWGVDFRPRFKANIGLGTRPMGGFDPNIDASAVWSATGRAFGQELRVFELNGSAVLNVCQQNVGATAKLFKQDVAVITSTDRGIAVDPGARVNCEHARGLLSNKLDKLKNAMVNAQQIYARVYQAGLKPTRAMCNSALGSGHSICNKVSPSAADITTVANTFIDEYNMRWARQADDLLEEKTGVTAAINGVKPLVNDGYSGNVRLLDARARFGIAAVTAVIPIGPLSLVLAVEGSGDWGVPGGIEYGMQFYQNGSRAPGASTTIDVGPAAGINVLLYVGVGISIGVAGADVGIGGDVRLIDIGTPILVRASVERAGTVADARPLLPAWGGTLGTKGTRPRTQQWRISTSMYGKATMSMLKGEIDVRVRVYFLFFSKTWKKRVAKLPGFTLPDVTVVAASNSQPLVQTPALLDAMPQIAFPNVPNVPTYASGGWGPATDSTLLEVGTIVGIGCHPLVE